MIGALVVGVSTVVMLAGGKKKPRTEDDDIADLAVEQGAEVVDAEEEDAIDDEVADLDDAEAQDVLDLADELAAEDGGDGEVGGGAAIEDEVADLPDEAADEVLDLAEEIAAEDAAPGAVIEEVLPDAADEEEIDEEVADLPDEAADEVLDLAEEIAAEDSAPDAPEDEEIKADDSATADLVTLLLDAEDSGEKSWKSQHQSKVRSWQSTMGLVADGLFGAKSALKVAAQGASVIPLVRYWPSGSYPDGKWLPDYLNALENVESADADAVSVAIDRETGQGWGVPRALREEELA
jgi:hypothetical protein